MLKVIINKYKYSPDIRSDIKPWISLTNSGTCRSSMGCKKRIQKKLHKSYVRRYFSPWVTWHMWLLTQVLIVFLGYRSGTDLAYKKFMWETHCAIFLLPNKCLLLYGSEKNSINDAVFICVIFPENGCAWYIWKVIISRFAEIVNFKILLTS